MAFPPGSGPMMHPHVGMGVPRTLDPSYHTLSHGYLPHQTAPEKVGPKKRKKYDISPEDELWTNTIWSCLGCFLLSMFVITYFSFYHYRLVRAYVFLATAASITVLFSLTPNSLVRRMWPRTHVPTWMTRRHIPVLLQIAATFVGMFFGYWIYKAFGESAAVYSNMRVYRNAVPSTKAEAFLDGGRMVFSQGSHVDKSKAVGYYDNDGTLYCVAAVKSSEASVQRVEFWAVGTNCCEKSFECGGVIHDPMARGGIAVMDKRGLLPGASVRSKFDKAREKAEASFGFSPNDDVAYVRWVASDLAEDYARELQCVLCRCFMLACLFYYMVLHRLHLHVLWTHVGPGHMFANSTAAAYYASPTSKEYMKEMEGEEVVPEEPKEEEKKEEDQGPEHGHGHMMMHGMMPPGMMAPGMMAPGMMAPGMMAPGMMAPGMMAPGMGGPGMMGPGMPGTVLPGTMGPSMMGAAMAGPGMMAPGLPGTMGPSMMGTGMVPGHMPPGMNPGYVPERRSKAKAAAAGDAADREGEANVEEGDAEKAEEKKPLLPPPQLPEPEMHQGWTFRMLLWSTVVSCFVVFVITMIVIFPYSSVAFSGSWSLDGFLDDSWLTAWTRIFCWVCPFYHYNIMASGAA